jgi:hypothetical protein
MKPKPAPQPEFSLEGLAPKNVTDESHTTDYLLNPAKVRRYALDLAERELHHDFTAVSVEFIQRIDARLRNIIRDEIKRHPSRGKRLS